MGGSSEGKVRHIQANPEVSLVVHEQVLPYRGVEASGRATLSADGFHDVVRRTAARYYSPQEADAFAAAYTAPGLVIRLVPQRIRAWDFKDDVEGGDRDGTAGEAQATASAGPAGAGSDHGGATSTRTGSVPTQGLAGTSWRLVQLGVEAPIAETEITANFAADGSLGGSAGCNRYFGTYTAGGSHLSTSPLATTRMACLSDVNRQEARFLAALQASDTWIVDRGRLRLTGGDPGLLFEPA